MPISQQIGSSSLAKPGVCTSTTRPASPYEGQMIYETDTDEIHIWTGASWLSVPEYTFSKVSGDATISSTGVLTIPDATYTNVAFNTGWADYGAGYGPCQYAKSKDGFVHMQGLARRTSGSNTVIFTLPVGFRPNQNVLCGVIGSGGVGRIDAYPNGNVEFINSPAGSVNVGDWISLQGVCFYAV